MSEQLSEQLKLHNPCSPGEIIQEVYLKPYNISARELAVKLKVAPSTVSRLLKGEIGLSADMALRISAVLGRSPGSWMNMQKNYALWQAEQSFAVDEFERIDFNVLTRIEEEDVDLNTLEDKEKGSLPEAV